MASPPLLVMLGLTLPDSRILNGIASIGLTLTNIAIILPHLRQPILESMHALEGALADEKSTQGQTELSLSLHKFSATLPTDLNVENPVLALVSSTEGEHLNSPLTFSATIESVCSAVTDTLGPSNVDIEDAPHSTLSPSAGKTDNDNIHPRFHHPLNADSLSSGHLFAGESRCALYIPLPVSDSTEVAFFDTEDATFSDSDLGEERPVTACEQHTVLEVCPAVDDYELISGKGIDRDGQLVAADLPSTQRHIEVGVDSTDVPMAVAVRDHKPLGQDTVSDLPQVLLARGSTGQSTQAKHPLLAKRRPESLEFIPQSIIRRYSSAPIVSVGQCFRYRVFNAGQDHQLSPAPPYVFVHNPPVPQEQTRPRASNTTLEGHWRASFPTEVHLMARPTRGKTSVVETMPAQGPFKQESTLLPEAHELTPLKKYPTQKRRLGVLARAALRDRRSVACRRRNDGNEESSTFDSDSDFSSDSQHSSGSSVYESMLPHMLGADLIAAIDANSESELNLVASRRTMRVPLDASENFLVPEDSMADLSIAMHLPSNDDTSDGEVRAPATGRSLAYEDIQQWASGVVQKCMRQVCRTPASVEPSSPSQASDVCAERPSGSGVSQCPLSGLHCKPGAVALTEVSTPKNKELPASLPPRSTLPSRMPLRVRNLGDIPEFVPRQRHVPMVTGHSARVTIDVTRDAATRVIARVEDQAGFHTRHWVVGTEGKRRVNTAGGRQGTLRCA